jgi:hypothetical protein
MKFQKLIALTVFITLISQISSAPPPPDINELVRMAGFTLQTHQVQTSDGYILSLFRIPARRHQNVEDNNDDR